MNILVIGNGFDLAHKLRTGYNDFIRIVMQEDIQEDIGKVIEKYIIEKNLYYEEFQDCVNDNIWVKHFIDEYNKKKIGDRWVDFEAEISEVIKIIEYFRNGDGRLIEYRKFSEEEEFWYKKIKNIVKGSRNGKIVPISMNNELIKRMEDDLKGLIRALEIYLSLFVESIEINKAMSISNIDKVITFNYTDTYQRNYDLNNEIEYDYIHGKVNIESTIEKNDMVLGIDEYLDDEKKDQDLDFIFFKKYFQRIYKRTGCKYKEWLEDINQGNYESNNFYIFGHSLAKSDKDILRDLILCNNAKTIIYYHNDEAYRNQITNLVDIIGQDKLIEKVYGSCPSIEFVSIENIKELEIKGVKQINYLDMPTIIL